MALNIFNGKTDLGDTSAMFSAYRHFGELSPDLTYDALHGSLHAVLAETDDVHPDDLRRLGEQVRSFRSEFSRKLSEHELWMLAQLEEAASTVTNDHR